MAPCLQFYLWTKYRAREGTKDTTVENRAFFFVSLQKRNGELIIGSIPEQAIFLFVEFLASRSETEKNQHPSDIKKTRSPDPCDFSIH